jgi:hypothetical protein
MNKYYESRPKPKIWEIRDTDSDILIGTVTYEKERERFVAVPVGVKKPVRDFMFLHCAIGYIGACTYNKSISKSKDKQLNLVL